MFHKQQEVCIRFAKNSNLTNSEVSKIMSIENLFHTRFVTKNSNKVENFMVIRTDLTLSYTWRNITTENLNLRVGVAVIFKNWGGGH